MIVLNLLKINSLFAKKHLDNHNFLCYYMVTTIADTVYLLVVPPNLEYVNTRGTSYGCSN